MDEREVEHIHHAAVEPTGVAEEFAVEHAVDNVAQRPGDDERYRCEKTRLRLGFVNQRMDVPTEQTHRQQTEERQRQFAEPLDAEGHAVVLNIAYPEP